MGRTTKISYFRWKKNELDILCAALKPFRDCRKN